MGKPTINCHVQQLSQITRGYILYLAMIWGDVPRFSGESGRCGTRFGGDFVMIFWRFWMTWGSCGVSFGVFRPELIWCDFRIMWEWCWIILVLIWVAGFPTIVSWMKMWIKLLTNGDTMVAEHEDLARMGPSYWNLLLLGLALLNLLVSSCFMYQYFENCWIQYVWSSSSDLNPAFAALNPISSDDHHLSP